MGSHIELKNCPITGIEVLNHSAERLRFDEQIFYQLDYEGETRRMIICKKLNRLLSKKDQNSEDNRIIKERKELQECLPIFLGELGKANFEGLWGKAIHFNCNPKDSDTSRHLFIKNLAEEVKSRKDYPQNRKEKTNLILKAIKVTQTFDGEKVRVINEFGFWGRFYLRNSEEFEFYLGELENRGYIKIEAPYVSLTGKGLDYLDNLTTEIKPEFSGKEKRYQIGLSFAGEDRDFVEKVALELDQNGIRVFYDNFENDDLWGKDLYQHLNNIYKNECEYCIIFISSSYAKKRWTSHELKSAQTRAFSENREYILPVRFDETELPGLNETVGYISGSFKSPEEIAQLAMKKLNI